jgi:hypothetical protein
LDIHVYNIKSHQFWTSAFDTPKLDNRCQILDKRIGPQASKMVWGCMDFPLQRSLLARSRNNHGALHRLSLNAGKYEGLGAALVGNTVVSEINFLYADVLADTNPANSKLVLEFLQNNSSANPSSCSQVSLS